MRIDTEVRRLWEAAGYTIRDNTGGHARIYDGDRFVTGLSTSASTWRAIQLAKYSIRQDQKYRRRLQPQRQGERKVVSEPEVREEAPGRPKPASTVRDERPKIIDPIDLSVVTTGFGRKDKTAGNRARLAEKRARQGDPVWGRPDDIHQCFSCERGFRLKSMFFILAEGTPAELDRWGKRFELRFVYFSQAGGTATVRIEWCGICAPKIALPVAPVFNPDEDRAFEIRKKATPDRWDEWAEVLRREPSRRRPERWRVFYL